MSGVDPLAWIDSEAEERGRQGLARKLTAVSGLSAGHLRVGGRDLVNFGSNDYLGLAADERVVGAGRKAAEQYGWGAGASPLVCGWTDVHEELVEALSHFEGCEAVALFPSGFAANLGTIAALVGPGDVVYQDRLNHACLIDGARLSRAKLRVYPHNDVEKLDEILFRDKGQFRRSLIATDGVFSMDGDLARLPEIVPLAEQFGSMLLVDEAHGTGVFGLDGRGSASEFGVEERVSIRVGTLSKALGSVGGFVAGSRRLINHLTNRAHSLIYSTSMPTAAAASAKESLAIVRAEPWRRVHVHALARRLRELLRREGFEPGGSEGPIVPVRVGDPSKAIRVSGFLRERGLFIPAIRPPTVPAGTSRLRISVTAAHRAEEVDTLFGAIIEARAAGQF